MSQAHSDQHTSCVLKTLEGRSDPAAQLPEAEASERLIASWQRCGAQYGLDPVKEPGDRVHHRQRVREQVDALGEFFVLAQREMHMLYELIAGTARTVVLTDSEGMILEQYTDTSLEEAFATVRICPGADWSESGLGTNGVGTAIVDLLPLLVQRDQHFLSCNTPLSCAGVPIIAPTGEVMAALDVSSVHREDARESDLHTLALVQMSARAIENQNLLCVHRHDHVIRFHLQPEFVGVMNEGLLAFDEHALVVGGNASATFMLGYPAPTDLLGRRIDELFDVPEPWLDQSMKTTEVTIRPIREKRGGRRFFATVRYTEPVSGALRTKLPPCRVIELPKEKRQSQACEQTPRSLDDLRKTFDPRMAYNIRCAERLKDERIPILVQGETGVGKEIMARAIHESSLRREKPFVPVNCGSIPESLIESELFGYESGAFTGARREGRRGKLVQASGGTLFLDEIGDMPVPLQTRLLRVLEDQEVEALGSDTPVPIDLYLICATHRNLSERVARGEFREDLFYRINGVALTLPPFRERRDKEEIIWSTLESVARSGRVPRMEQKAFELLLAYEWPGNLRQLRNCLATAVALCDEDLIRGADLPSMVPGWWDRPPIKGESESRPSPASRGLELPGQEEGSDEGADGMLRVLERYRWNITAVAEALGVSRSTVYRRMRKLGIPLSQQSGSHQSA